ncbi:dual specificity protein phosphatase family protein [Psychroserpens sp. AS72]|uniref:dual specificity protein phosphatase family protein n=1 Tax=Psychroserpens sp. AS72 TaxID=3135775 RepID=UPI00316DF594
MKKKVGLLVLVIVIIGVVKFCYDVHINYNFKSIAENKVYKSGVIPPGEIENYVNMYNIKSIVDLRFPGTDDLENNPEIPEELTLEKNAVEKIGNINYYNVGAEQVPSQEAVDKFLKIMDNNDNYPVLIHCHHGDGRAPLFSAIYRMEYENMPNEEARDETRVLVKWSSFDDGKPKGEFLKNYKKRS